eukprot:scaffold11257_cov133-Isochrysis_galbana.AAC.3
MLQRPAHRRPVSAEWHERGACVDRGQRKQCRGAFANTVQIMGLEGQSDVKIRGDQFPPESKRLGGWPQQDHEMARASLAPRRSGAERDKYARCTHGGRILQEGLT